MAIHAANVGVGQLDVPGKVQQMSGMAEIDEIHLSAFEQAGAKRRGPNARECYLKQPDSTEAAGKINN